MALAPGKLALFLPLAPLAGTMQAYLKKKNVTVPGSKLDYPENLARQFYQVAILKKAPLTKGVGLMDKNTKHLERADEAATIADSAIDLASNAVPGGAAAAGIIKAIINFIKGMKKKHNAAIAGTTAKVATTATDATATVDNSTTLTPDESKAVGDAPLDSQLVTNADKAQDTMANAGIGNVNSKSEAVVNGTVIKLTPTGEIDDYGSGLVGAVRRAFHHHPKHKETLIAHLQHLDQSVSTDKADPLKSTKIAASEVPDDTVKKPTGNIFERLFTSIKHKLHIDSLEHAEGKCEGHKCKPKKKHHKKRK